MRRDARVNFVVPQFNSLASTSIVSSFKHHRKGDSTSELSSKAPSSSSIPRRTREADDSTPQRANLESAGNPDNTGYELHKMETVDSLVERARRLSLHQSQPLDKLHPTVDAHLKKIYEALTGSPEKDAFIQAVQHDSPPDDQATDPLASMDAFCAYMKSAASSAQAPAAELDLSAPISDYYISSSHNTYLTGNQLYGDAAASAYTSVRPPTHCGYIPCWNSKFLHVGLGASRFLRGF